MSKPRRLARLLARWLRPRHTTYDDGRGLLVIGDDLPNEKRYAAEPGETRPAFDGIRGRARETRPREER